MLNIPNFSGVYCILYPYSPRCGARSRRRDFFARSGNKSIKKRKLLNGESA